MTTDKIIYMNLESHNLPVWFRCIKNDLLSVILIWTKLQSYISESSYNIRDVGNGLFIHVNFSDLQKNKIIRTNIYSKNPQKPMPHLP